MVAEKEEQKKVLTLLKDAEEEYKRRKERLGMISQTKVNLDDTYAVVQLMKHPETGIPVK